MTARRSAARFLGMSNETFFAALERDSFAHLGCALPADFRERCHARYHALLDDRLAEVPGAREAVAAVRHPKAVASSSERRRSKEAQEVRPVGSFRPPCLFGRSCGSRQAGARPVPACGRGARPSARSAVWCWKTAPMASWRRGRRACGSGAFSAAVTIWGPAAGHGSKAAGAERLVETWPAATPLLAETLGVP